MFFYHEDREEIKKISDDIITLNYRINDLQTSIENFEKVIISTVTTTLRALYEQMLNNNQEKDKILSKKDKKTTKTKRKYNKRAKKENNEHSDKQPHPS